MNRSEKSFPMAGLDISGNLKRAWEDGWLDEFSDEHFLIKAIEKRLEYYPRVHQIEQSQAVPYVITRDNFQENFCVNFSVKVGRLISLFGEKDIHRFFVDQLSAGKGNYDEDQFFRALSEVSILIYLGTKAKSGNYEPKTNGKKNPEARLQLVNEVTVDVEVKTPGFKDFHGITNIVIPTVLLTDKGRESFFSCCNLHGLHGAMPRVMKVKDFLNSAAVKFEQVDHIHHINLLYINWTLSEFEEAGYEEAFALMAHPLNGILTHKEIGLSLGVDKEVYDKITAVIVYTESLQGLMFGDFRYVWNKGFDGQPQFGIIGLHCCEGLFEVTGMNPYAKQLTPIMTGIFKDTSVVSDLLEIIGENMLLQRS